MLRPARLLLLSAGVLVLGTAGCARVPAGAVDASGESCPPDSDCYDVPKAIGDGGSFSIEATEFQFMDLQGTYWAGDIHVELDNVGGAEHNLTFVGANEGSDNPVAQALGGETAEGTVNLFEGEYVYFCSIPGHRAQGMEGTLTVYATQDEAEANLATDQGSASESASDGASASETESASATESASPTSSETATEG